MSNFVDYLSRNGADWPDWKPENKQAMEQLLLLEVAELIKAGISVNWPKDSPMTPLRLAAIDGNTERISLLVSLGADPKQDHEALMLAALGGELKAVELLIEFGVDVNAVSEKFEAPAVFVAGKARGMSSKRSSNTTQKCPPVPPIGMTICFT